MTHIVRVVGLADGTPGPHADRYVVRWNPHTEFGTCEIDTTDDPNKARKFDSMATAHDEWRTISKVQPRRPDGKPNRPLAGLTVEITRLDYR